MNLLNLNVLNFDHNFHVNFNIFSRLSQIFKKEIMIENIICYNNLYLMNLINTNIIVLLL
jgi:hypothetical protein